MTPDEVRRKIIEGCEALGQEPGDAQLRKYVSLLAELERWGARVNLTAMRDVRDMISGHLLDSLAVRPYLHGRRIIDIGTGAGFPGLPLAIAEPDRVFTLLDSNGKKIGFVQHIVTTLGLRNVWPMRARAEDYAPEVVFDTVVARALATIPKIIEIGGHLVNQKGVLLALKGRYPAAELEQTERLPGAWRWTTDEISVPGLPQHSRHIISLTKKD